MTDPIEQMDELANRLRKAVEPLGLKLVVASIPVGTQDGEPNHHLQAIFEIELAELGKPSDQKEVDAAFAALVAQTRQEDEEAKFKDQLERNMKLAKGFLNEDD
jgi:hypothetical protein